MKLENFLLSEQLYKQLLATDPDYVRKGTYRVILEGDIDQRFIAKQRTLKLVSWLKAEATPEFAENKPRISIEEAEEWLKFLSQPPPERDPLTPLSYEGEPVVLRGGITVKLRELRKSDAIDLMDYFEKCSVWQRQQMKVYGKDSLLESCLQWYLQHSQSSVIVLAHDECDQICGVAALFQEGGHSQRLSFTILGAFDEVDLTEKLVEVMVSFSQNHFSKLFAFLPAFWARGTTALQLNNFSHTPIGTMPNSMDQGQRTDETFFWRER